MTDRTDKDRRPSGETWYLRVEDDAVYGPVDPEALLAWCHEGRIEPDHEISRDGANWQPAQSVPELEMDWMVCLEDGDRLGPFRLDMIPALVHEGVIPAGARLEHRETGEMRPADPDAGPADAPANAGPDAGPDDAPDDRSSESALSRLEPLQRSASEARRELADTRRALHQLRAEHTVQEDEVRRLREELSVARETNREHEQQALDAQRRATEAETEIGNLKAQLDQIQDHYDRLQLENQSQFEQLDALNAERVEHQQRYQREREQWRRAADQKTDLMAGAMQAMLRDTDLSHRFQDARSPAAGDQPASGHDAPETDRLLEKIRQLEQRVQQERHRREADRPARPRWPVPAALAFLALLVFLLAIPRRASREDRSPVVDDASPPAEDFADAAGAAAALDLQPDTSLLPASDGSTNAYSSVSWPEISLPRARITRTPHSLRMVFSYGLFTAGTRLAPEAEKDLLALAGQLTLPWEHYQLIIEGHTDATPVLSGGSHYVDNFALGMARAEKVKSYLAASGGLPADAMRTASAGDASPLYANDNETGRLKNRTAVLMLVRR